MRGMCGICGVVYADPKRRPDEGLLRRMCDLLAHRGPDGEGVEILGEAGLGHRRLIVIDPAGGAQPMFNEDHSVAIVFNGEIYNFRELRARLAQGGHRLATDHSDTEAILHLYEDRGVDCLQDLRGMFAFALWDARRHRLFLARDRAGKKPLYYAVADGALWFASEMKALLAVSAIPRRVSARAIHDFLTHQYVPAPQTIFQDIQKLPQAHYLTWENGRVEIGRYWQLNYEPKAAVSEAEALRQADALIEEAVRLRLESDVPLGVFLSGGIDSSLTVAMMRRHVSGPLKTFSIGFEEEGYSELPYARQVAKRYETEHEEFVVRADAARALPKLVWHFDEPFADMAAVPTLYLSEMTRRRVTVALNGDGGDELFAGYERYRGLHVFRWWQRVPEWFRRYVFAGPSRWASRAFPGSAFLGNVRYVNDTTLADPAWRYTARLLIFREDQKDRLYTPEFARAVGPGSSLDWMIGHYNRADLKAEVDRMMNCDVETYLPGDLLPKVDRTTMAYGLEGRSPLLDHKVMEFGAALPAEIKFPQQRLKKLLRKLAEPLLPPGLTERPKRGFSTPLGIWFKRDLKDLTRELIVSDRAVRRGLFRRSVLERMLRDHETGRDNHHHRLWALMCLETWFRTFVDRADISGGPI
ncbi:MAG: asparagine synthase (glutamine-hydrolyzing) [Candidatus Sumerlaeota bacterium]|nr:asparagine synthase (glutamine-hydrolyzing) [Candidatus Sumerlaeota bacterium]